MNSGRYVLDENRRVVLCEDLLTWAHWFERSHEARVVGQTAMPGVLVSTIFLGLNMNVMGGSPVFWETMTFSSNEKINGHQLRCAGTWEQAEAMHQQMVEWVKEQLW